MTAPAILDLAAQATVARYLPPARAWLAALHDDAEVTYGQAEERAAELAGRAEFRAAVDEATATDRARADRAEGLARQMAVTLRRWRFEAERQQRINAGGLVILAGIDPNANPGHISKELGDLRTWLRDSRGHAVFAGEVDAAELEACIARHPAGRQLRPATLDDFTE